MERPSTVRVQSTHGLDSTTLGPARSIASTHLKPIESRSKAIHEASSAIKDQERQLREDTARLARQSKKWEKLVDKGTKELKEIGDVQNWAEVIERELLVIEEVLRIVEGESEAGTGSDGRPENLASGSRTKA